MYCEKCGSKNEMTSEFCTNCGNKLNKELSNTNVNNTTVINTEEEKNTFGWGVLGFFIPIVGLILFICWKKDRPKASKSAGIGALVSVIAYVLLIILIIVIAFIVGLSSAKDSTDYTGTDIDNYKDNYDYDYDSDDDNDNDDYDTDIKEENKTVNAGEVFEFSNMQISIGTDYTFTTLNSSDSTKNGMTLVKLPITVKILSNDENHLNMFYSNIYDPSDKKLTKQSTYFDDTIDYADDLKSGESYTKYYYFEYTTDGTYKVKFNNYTSKIDVNVAIKK